MLARTVCVFGLAMCLASAALADAVVTYESYDDLTPDDDAIVLDAPGTAHNSATIEVWLTPTDNMPSSISQGGFYYQGEMFQPGAVISPDGGLTSSNHAWAEPFQDEASWYAIDDLPIPQVVTFFGGIGVPVEGLLLSTLTLKGNEIGTWTQPTGAGNFQDWNFQDFHLESGSDFFTVTVVPEPAAATLLAVLLVGLRSRRRRISE